MQILSAQQQEKEGKLLKIYLRNRKKNAKIVRLPPIVPAQQLYRLGSSSYNLPIQKISLYFGGNLIQNNEKVNLEENGIVHVVDIDNLDIEDLVIYIKKVEDNASSIKFKVEARTTIKDFINSMLWQRYGQNSDSVFLVYLGRQLKNQNTFLAERVENQSQLLCMNFLLNQRTQQRKQSFHEIKIRTLISNNENQCEKSPNIYPLPNFTITIPKQIQTNSNRLNLIFDSNIRRSSSIQNIDFSPEDVIEEEDVPFLNHSSCQSENVSNNAEQRESVISGYSQKIKGQFQFNDNGQAKEKKESRQNKKHLIRQRNDLIYSEHINILDSDHIMKEILQDCEKHLDSLQNSNIQKEEQN